MNDYNELIKVFNKIYEEFHRYNNLKEIELNCQMCLKNVRCLGCNIHNFIDNNTKTNNKIEDINND